jgi:RNA polymerase sigma-70 factor, ECF subfamily
MPEQKDSEKALLRRVRRGDLAAFTDLIAAFEGPLCGYALRLSKNHAEAEDITQESLLRLFRAARTGKLKTSARSYAFSTAHNLCIDLRRRRARIVELTDRACPEPRQNAEQELLRREINRALDHLPANHRAALLLREFGQLSYAEIAANLGVAENRVKVWIHRARKKLSQLLDRDGQYAGDKRDGA